MRFQPLHLKIAAYHSTAHGKRQVPVLHPAVHQVTAIHPSRAMPPAASQHASEPSTTHGKRDARAASRSTPSQRQAHKPTAMSAAALFSNTPACQIQIIAHGKASVHAASCSTTISSRQSTHQCDATRRISTCQRTIAPPMARQVLELHPAAYQDSAKQSTNLVQYQPLPLTYQRTTSLPMARQLFSRCIPQHTKPKQNVYLFMLPAASQHASKPNHCP